MSIFTDAVGVDVTVGVGGVVVVYVTIGADVAVLWC